MRCGGSTGGFSLVVVPGWQQTRSFHCKMMGFHCVAMVGGRGSSSVRCTSKRWDFHAVRWEYGLILGAVVPWWQQHRSLHCKMMGFHCVAVGVGAVLGGSTLLETKTTPSPWRNNQRGKLADGHRHELLDFINQFSERGNHEVGRVWKARAAAFLRATRN